MHPFSAPQCGGLHIFGTFDNGDIQFLYAPVTATVFKRGEEYCIRMKVYDFFNIRIHAVAYVGN